MQLTTCAQILILRVSKPAVKDYSVKFNLLFTSQQ